MLSLSPARSADSGGLVRVVAVLAVAAHTKKRIRHDNEPGNRACARLLHGLQLSSSPSLPLPPLGSFSSLSACMRVCACVRVLFFSSADELCVDSASGPVYAGGIAVVRLDANFLSGRVGSRLRVLLGL